MEFKKKFIGIDLATRIENSAIFTIGETSDKKLKILYETDLHELSKGTTMPSIFEKIKALETQHPSHETIVAIDVPFGYPAEFITWVSNFNLTGSKSVDLSHLKFRQTERWLNDYAKKHWKVSGFTGLSVSMDKLGVTFTVGAALISEMTNSLNFQISMGDKPDASKLIIEVYPKASMMSWFHNTKDIVRKYRGSDSDRKALANRLIGKFDNLFYSDMLTFFEFFDDHSIDAFVAAMTARAYSENECLLPDEMLQPNEGWIWIPK